MNYTSVAQIFETIDETRQRLYAVVEKLNEAQQAARRSPDTWSVTEIVEHLAILEDRLVRMMQVMLTKAASAAPSNAAPVDMETFSLDPFTEEARDKKYVAPEGVRPGGADQLSDVLVRMRGSREDLHALRPRIEATDMSTATYPHPAFGPLNLYQWLAFIGIHEERHLRQLESVLSV